jgi:CDP-glycerol glycerophosphotransferase
MALVPQARARAHSIARRAGLGRARYKALLTYYDARRRSPLDPDLAVFAAYWYRGFQCNPRGIYEAMRQLVPEARGVWVVNADRAPAVPAGVEHVVAGTRRYFDVLARARVFVNNVNYPNYLVKRPGTVHVMTHHGTPLKLMGTDLRGRPVDSADSDFEALVRRCARWDFAVSQNAYSTPIFERAFPGTYETLEVGYPRNDMLAQASREDVERVRGELGIAPGRRAVLYAPTHRDNESGYVERLDVAELGARLGEEWVVLARPHHRYVAGTAWQAMQDAGRLIDVASHPSVEALCLAADVLVTDYSSIMFDFAVLDRPIVAHVPDWEEYRAERGTYFDLTAEPPGTVTRSTQDLVGALQGGEAFGERATAARAAFRARFCSRDDGLASARIVQRLWPDRVDPARLGDARLAGGYGLRR